MSIENHVVQLNKRIYHVFDFFMDINEWCSRDMVTCISFINDLNNNAIDVLVESIIKEEQL